MKKIIILCCTLLICFSASKLVDIKKQEDENKKYYSHLQEIYHLTQRTDIVSEDNYQQESEPVSLHELNDDYLGWIELIGTTISYPVVQSYDNNDYLYRNFEGCWSNYGTPFLDKNTQPEDPYKIIYGHSGNAGQMFTDLKYLLDSDYLALHDTIKCFSKTYKIISVNIVNIDTDLPYWDLPLMNAERKQYIIEAYKNASMIPLEKVNDNNDYILLSTCLIDLGDDARLLIIAQCVGGCTSTSEGESIE